MINYRPHRGSLVDSMDESQEFVSEIDMMKYIIKQWSNFLSIESLSIDPKSMDDDRIGWHDSHYVCTSRMGDDIYETPQCIGICNYNL